MTAHEILEAFPQKTALIVGDICLDYWCTYDPAYAEPSRETGLSRLAVVSTEVSPGGGGTVANNLMALGIGRACVLGAIGTDGHGQDLMEALNSRNISSDLLIRSSDVPTFTYTKLINAESGEEDSPRVDFINTRRMPEKVERQILDHLRMFASAFEVIYVSDQAETRRGGMVTPAIRNLLFEIASQDPEKIVWVDSRIRSELFRGVILKPNQEEAESSSIALLGCVDYVRYRELVNAPALFVTHGPRGVLVVDAKQQTFVPTRHVQAVDICGAGDSFSAGAGIALAASGSALDAARFGNLVASITVTKKGTGTASPGEVRSAAAEMGW